MDKGRNIYSFNLACDISLINSCILNFISGNNFIQITENGETFFRAGDAFIGYKYFNYSINNNVLTITAWMHSAFGDIKVEQNGITQINIWINQYRNLLNKLFQDINNLNQSNNYISQATTNVLQSNENINKYAEESNKRNEKLCEIGFWLSILGFIASFGDFIYGILVYIVIFYFASVGLKTRKRKKAIASIVFASLSILIVIVRLIGIWIIK